MNLLEVVSEKFLGTNAAKVIANYPDHFVKLLIKKLEQEVGEVKDKVADEKTTWLSEPIFKPDRRGKITAEFPKRRLDITIQPKATGRPWIPSYHVSLELLPSMKLEISPTGELVDITRLTIGELINKVVDAAKETRVSRARTRHEPEEIHLKSIRKIMTDHGLKLKASYYKGSISDDEYDYSFEIYMMDESSFKKKDTTEIYRVMPAVIKWHNANNMVLKRHGLCAGNDYYYLQSIHKREPHEKNRGVYRNMALQKPKIIGDLF